MGGKIPPISFTDVHKRYQLMPFPFRSFNTEWRCLKLQWLKSYKALKAEVSPSERKMCLPSFTTFTVSISWAKDWGGSSSNHLSDPYMTHFLTGLFEDTLPPHIFEELRGEHSHSIGKVTHYWPQACKCEDGYESKGKLEKEKTKIK